MRENNLMLHDKKAVITGGAMGIGRTTAELFAERGAGVVIIDLNESAGKETLYSIKKGSDSAWFIKADVTSSEEVGRAFEEACDYMGGIEILVNCVGGYTRYINFEEISEEDWDRTIELNLKSVFLCCKSVIPYMKESGWGRIINLGSLAGRSTSAGTSPAHYGTAKCAVSMLTQYIAKELAPYGITANTIAPGTTLTERVRSLLTEEKEKLFIKATPLGRLAQPEEIASVIAFIASDESRYITGVTIDVNGGRLMLI